MDSKFVLRSLGQVSAKSIKHFNTESSTLATTLSRTAWDKQENIFVT